MSIKDDQLCLPGMVPPEGPAPLGQAANPVSDELVSATATTATAAAAADVVTDVGTGAVTPRPAIDLSQPPRLRKVDRSQVRMMPMSLDESLPAEHDARMVWNVVASLDLSKFKARIAARGSMPGRAATDPHILIALWVYATLQREGRGREIARLVDCHDGYRWLAGGVTLNYHTINDFRVEREAEMDDLLSQIVAVLIEADLVDVSRLAQDGIRVRASAGAGSFHREASLKETYKQVLALVQSLKAQDDPALSAQQQAKRLADAQAKAARTAEAIQQLAQMQEQEQATAARAGREPKQMRASTTDPDARRMKMPDGGTRPAYNVQLAADTKGRAIVGVAVTSEGVDFEQSQPMREQVQERSGDKVDDQLLDGGYVKLEVIDAAEKSGVKIYAPVPDKNGSRGHLKGDAAAQEAAKFDRKKGDTDYTYQWRQRMATEEAKTIYKQRGSTIETINGDLAQHRGLRQMPVRGSPKVRCVALLFAITHNIMRFGTELITAGSD